MPKAHREDDLRFCDAKTWVINQSTVFVNDKLWAVEGDLDDHCEMGALIAVYGPPSVKIEDKYVICAVGDEAEPDYENCGIPEHPTGATNPKTGSPDVYVYGGGTGGGTVT